MYIGVYLCLGSAFYLAGLAWLIRWERRMLVYSGLSWALLLASLAVFEVVSVRAGLIPFRQVGSFSFPRDFLARGPRGWLLMLLPMLGAISPLLVVLWVRRKS